MTFWIFMILAGLVWTRHNISPNCKVMIFNFRGMDCYWSQFVITSNSNPEKRIVLGVQNSPTHFLGGVILDSRKIMNFWIILHRFKISTGGLFRKNSQCIVSFWLFIQILYISCTVDLYGNVSQMAPPHLVYKIHV